MLYVTYYVNILWGIMEWPGLAALRDMLHRFLGIESMAYGTLYNFQFWRNQGTSSGSNAFRLPCVSLCFLEASEESRSFTG